MCVKTMRKVEECEVVFSRIVTQALGKRWKGKEG